MNCIDALAAAVPTQMAAALDAQFDKKQYDSIRVEGCVRVSRLLSAARAGLCLRRGPHAGSCRPGSALPADGFKARQTRPGRFASLSPPRR